MAKDIRPLQMKAAVEIEKHYMSIEEDNYPPVLLIAQPQSGKTGAVIEAVERIIRYNQSRSNNKTSTFWLQPSDSELKDQTKDRIATTSAAVHESLLGDEIYHTPSLNDNGNAPSMGKIANRAMLKKLYHDAKTSKDFLVVVIDEAHIGIGKDQTMPDFFKSCLGFFPGFEDSADNVFTIIVTATPGSYLNYANEKRKMKNGDSFKYVFLETDANYNAFKLMKVNNRFHESFPVKTTADYTQFENDELKPFLALKPSDGYIYIARISRENDLLHKELEKAAKKYGFILEIYTSKKGNIAALAKRLKWPHRTDNKKVVCLIIGSYLQGKTFEDMSNIGGWWDRASVSSHETFTAQSAGRNCGYGKTGYTYPVCINPDHVDNIIDFYDTAELANRTGNWLLLEQKLLANTFTNENKGTKAKIVWQKIAEFSDEKSAKAFAKANNKTSRTIPIKRHAYEDIASELVNNHNSPNLGRANGNKEKDVAIVIADDACPTYKASWTVLDAKYNNQLKGKVFYYENIGTMVSSVLDKSVLSENYSYNRNTAKIAAVPATSTIQTAVKAIAELEKYHNVNGLEEVRSLMAEQAKLNEKDTLR